MEYHNSIQNLKRPSAAFIIKAALVILTIGGFILYKSGGFAFLQKRNKKNISSPLMNNKVTTFEDSNSNGISDWEERLWGLDPTKTMTNGIANAQIIEQKKKKSENAENGNKKMNKTEEITQSLFVINNALATKGASEQISGSNAAVEQIVKGINPLQYKNYFSPKDLKMVKTTAKSVNLYKKELLKNLQQSKTSDNEISIIISALEKEDYTNISTLVSIGKNYQKIAKTIAKIPTPTGVSRTQLSLVNNIYNIGQSLVDTSIIVNDPVSATIAISAYKTYSLRVQEDIFTANEFLMGYTSK